MQTLYSCIKLYTDIQTKKKLILKLSVLIG